MRDEFFQFMVAYGHDLYYRIAYKRSSKRIGNVYSGFLLLTSAAGIASWSYWANNPTLWACITLAAQVFQVLKPLFSFDKQANALTFIVQDMQELFDEMEDYWHIVNSANPPSDTDIQSQITDFKKRDRAIKDRFAPDIDFPTKKHLLKQVSKDNQQYFKYYYNVEVKEEKKYVRK